MSENEIDTNTDYSRTPSPTCLPTRSQQKPILQQNYTQMDRDKQEKEILDFVKS